MKTRAKSMMSSIMDELEQQYRNKEDDLEALNEDLEAKLAQLMCENETLKREREDMNASAASSDAVLEAAREEVIRLADKRNSRSPPAPAAPPARLDRVMRDNPMSLAVDSRRQNNFGSVPQRPETSSSCKEMTMRPGRGRVIDFHG
ncbi:hypothetical protein DRE_04650 [Drechslerella stenobrocha 248]|uniref:Uncharacterized protein n=1 Tax=Drechslerella stenobrocha 248 TaxID=1043628 RepID=W7HPM8_9PEZI|nr:hypothetical protein DRE_04650 [Drechslerella stenobrocha 248]